MDKKLHDYLWHSCCEENARLKAELLDRNGHVLRLTRERDEASQRVEELEQDNVTLREGWDREEKLRRDRDAAYQKQVEESERERARLRGAACEPCPHIERAEAAEAKLDKLEHDWQIRYDRLWDEAEAIRLERDEWRDTAQGEMAGRRSAEAELARVVAAALDLVGEYESHGGEDTHQECLEGCGCVLPQKVAALRAAATGEESAHAYAMLRRERDEARAEVEELERELARPKHDVLRQLADAVERYGLMKVKAEAAEAKLAKVVRTLSEVRVKQDLAGVIIRALSAAKGE